MKNRILIIYYFINDLKYKIVKFLQIEQSSIHIHIIIQIIMYCILIFTES